MVAAPPPMLSVARLSVAVGAFLCLAAWAAAEGDPTARAEGLYLALLAGSGLVALAAIAPSPAGELWAAAPLVAAAVALHPGPQRAVAVTVVLVAALTAGAARRLRKDGGLRRETAVPLAIAAQLLARPELLLAGHDELWRLGSLVGLPLVAGLAIAALAERRGDMPAAIAGAATVLLAPGWTVTTAWSLAALAAGARLAARGPRGSWLAAWAVLLLPALWDPIGGPLLSLAAVALWRPAAAWLVGPAALLVAVAWPGGEPAAALAVWLPALCLLPTAAVPIGSQPRLLLAGAALMLAAGSAAPQAIAAGVGLAALGLPRRPPWRALQLTWSVTLLLLGGLLASYPWTRPAPLGDALGLFGLNGGVGSVLALAAGVAALGLLARALRPMGVPAPALGGLAIAAALWPSVATPAAVPVSHTAVPLDAERPVETWAVEEEARIAELVIDSSLVHGAALPAGTPVLAVEVYDAAGERRGLWSLRAGHDTAEWAAGRPDVAGQPGFEAPAPWISHVVAGSAFFGHRYRSRHRLGAPVAAARIVVRREPSLPPEVACVLHRLELRS